MAMMKKTVAKVPAKGSGKVGFVKTLSNTLKIGGDARKRRLDAAIEGTPPAKPPKRR